MQKHEFGNLAPASFLSDGLAQATTSEPHTTTVQSTAARQTVKTVSLILSGNTLLHAREVTMRAPGTTAAFGLKSVEQASFTPQTEESHSTARDTPPACLGFGYLASSLVQLLETAIRELDRNREVAKASLVTASTLLQAEVGRYSNDNGSARGGLAPWQMQRVRAFIDSNLHRTIHVRDLSAVAQRTPAHFSRKFKLAVGESPHAYVVRRRLERACHLMVTSAGSLSEIALSVGFSDQSHLCRHFRTVFSQSPASWRREHGNLGRDNPGANMNIT
jgi:AraC family transcriptional regulator